MATDARQDAIVEALEAVELPRPGPEVWAAIAGQLRPREPFVARWWPSLAGAALASAAAVLLLLGGAAPQVASRPARVAQAVSSDYEEVAPSALSEDRIVVSWYAEASGAPDWALAPGEAWVHVEGSAPTR